MTPDQVALGQRLLRARRLAGLTQRDVAAKLGRSQSWVQRIESGENRLSAGDLAQLAALYERPVQELVDAEDAAPIRSLLDWSEIFPGDPKRAAAHAALDAIIRAARQPEAAEGPSPQPGSQRAE